MQNAFLNQFSYTFQVRSYYRSRVKVQRNPKAQHLKENAYCYKALVLTLKTIFICVGASVRVCVQFLYKQFFLRTAVKVADIEKQNKKNIFREFNKAVV